MSYGMQWVHLGFAFEESLLELYRISSESLKPKGAATMNVKSMTCNQ